MGKAFWVRNNATGEQFSVAYTAEGNSNIWHIGHSATTPSYIGNPVRDGYEGVTTPYKIEGGKLVTNISQTPFSMTIYKLGDTYYGARSNEFGYANYEIIPSPQFVLNPLTATLNTFSIELGLNEQQKQQILPFLQDEAKQLGALKKNTSLKPLEKVEQLKQIGSAIDAKITPLLDPAATEEVPGHPRREATGNDREDGELERFRRWRPRYSRRCRARNKKNRWAGRSVALIMIGGFMKSKSKLWRYATMGAVTAVCVSVMFLASCQKAEQEISEEVAYLRGLESWVYGYPIVLMDVTRQVLTAAPAPNAEGTAAPMDQFAKMPHYVSPDCQGGGARQPQLAVVHWMDGPWTGAGGPFGPRYP